MANTLSQTSLDSFLGSLHYPLDHAALKHAAQVHHVSPELMLALEEMPLGEYRSKEDVLHMLKNHGYKFQ